MKLYKMLITLPIYIFGDIIFLLSYFIPKNKNLWIFGSWFGKKYADNSKYLFEYINKNNPEIIPIWITKSKNILKVLKEKGYRCYYASSIKGAYYALRAKLMVVSSGTMDINKFISKKTKVLQLWHGTPLKKIGYDDKTSFFLYKESKLKQNLRKVKKILFPFEYRKYDFMIATSEEAQKRFSSAFRISQENIFITGYPRNDIIMSQDEELEKININKILILQKNIRPSMIYFYLPTLRQKVKNSINILSDSSIQQVDKILKDLNSIMIVKMHYCHTKKINHDNLSKLSRIIYLTEEELLDIYPILRITDVLITDYSSVYFDFLLLDRPIIFFPYDLEKYIREDRGFYYEYENVVPGPVVYSWKEIINCIRNIQKINVDYSIQRKKICKLFNEYKDDKSCSRLVPIIKKYIN